MNKKKPLFWDKGQTTYIPNNLSGNVVVFDLPTQRQLPNNDIGFINR